MVAQTLKISTKLQQLAESAAYSQPENGSGEALLPSHSDFTDDFDSASLGLHASATPVDGATPGMSLGDYQMMLAGINVDSPWKGI